MRIHRLTIHSGAVETFQRDDLPTDLVGEFKTILRRGSNAAPPGRPDWEFALHLHEPMWNMELVAGSLQLAASWHCHAPNASGLAWGHLIQTSESAPREPPPTPWIATFVLPGHWGLEIEDRDHARNLEIAMSCAILELDAESIN